MSLDQSVDFELLEDAIRKALGESVRKISVKVERSKVYLYGSVHSVEERTQLERIACSVPGVAAVENYICVDLFA